MEAFWMACIGGFLLNLALSYLWHPQWSLILLRKLRVLKR
jgi:hypothetical protein